MLEVAEFGVRAVGVGMAVLGVYAFLAAAGWLPRMSVKGMWPELAGVVHVWLGTLAVGFGLMTSGFLYRGRPWVVWGMIVVMMLTIIGSIVRVNQIERRRGRET